MNINYLKSISDGYITLPIFLIKNLNKLNLSYEELIFLMYLNSNKKKILPEFNEFSQELNIDTTKIMEIVDSLCEKKYIDIVLDKKEKTEYISLNGFNKKINILLMNNENSEEITNDIYSLIEKEFGKTLSPIELQFIKAWIDQGTNIEIIKEALKEAVLNGVLSIKYMDRIIYDWNNKNITTPEELQKYKKTRQNDKDKIDDNIDMETLNWNWFDDEEVQEDE